MCRCTSVRKGPYGPTYVHDPECAEGRLLRLRIEAAGNKFHGNAKGLSTFDIDDLYVAIQGAEHDFIRHCNDGELRPLRHPNRK